MTANRKLTAAQRKALELLARDNANSGYYGTIFDLEGRTIGKTTRGTLESLLSRKLITEHPRKAGYIITPAGRAALGTSAATEPLPGEQDGYTLSLDEILLIERAIRESVVYDTLPPAFRDVADHLLDMKYLFKFSQFLKPTDKARDYHKVWRNDPTARGPLPFDGTPQPSDDAAARFDVLLTAYQVQRERLDSGEYKHIGTLQHQLDRLDTAEKELCQWVEQHASAIRAALRRIDGGSEQR